MFDTWQEKIFDRFFIRSDAPRAIVIVAIDDESIHAIGTWPWQRAVFARALTHLKEARAVGIDVSFTEDSSYGPADDRAFRETLQDIDTVVLPVQFDDRGGKVALPTSMLGAPKLGFVNMLLDADGVVRQLQTERSPYRAFSVELSGSASYPPQFRINYRGPTKTILTIPFIDVYQGNIPKSVFKDKIVLIGATANDLHDFMGTPFGTMSGVEVQGNAVATLASGVFPAEVPRTLALGLIMLVSLAAFALVCFVRRFSLLLLSSVALLVCIVLASIGLFAIHVLVPILYLLLSTLLSMGIIVALEYVTESKERRFIQKTFAYYLMPEIIDDLLKDPSKLRLGGEKRSVGILFSDIRGFTTLSEKLSAEELIQLMNEYLTAMTDVIMDNRGLVDKYIGDAIMAFWGAPVTNPNVEKDMCRAALGMMQKLRECNRLWTARGVPPLEIGIGLNTGEVVVGNMGSQKRFNYTIMGDEVNFCSRLEGITKSYGTPCIISESTAEAIANDPMFTLRELDVVKVKGKKEPKRIFELVTQPVTDTLCKQFGHFKEGKAAYMAGRFSEAARYFKKAMALGEDGPSRTFLARCEYLEANPPDIWEGMYEFTTK